MSFSSQLKSELAAILPPRECCAKAQTYGMLECGRSFSAESISIKTEHFGTAGLYKKLVSVCCGLHDGDCALEARASGVCVAGIPDAKIRADILDMFGHTPGEPFLRLNRSNLECDFCAGAYVRGVFLACGTITDPNVEYHLELSPPYLYLARDIQTLLREMDIETRIVRRKGINVLYIKDSGVIEDMLTHMGATNAALEIMNIKIMKDIRNAANRVVNCENANIDKTVAAAVRQNAHIRRMKESGRFDLMPEELRTLAELRMENPEMTLRELGAQMDPPLSRSGVNHRLKRIMEF